MINNSIWHSGESVESFIHHSGYKPMVCSIEFCTCFLKHWNPPSSIHWFLGVKRIELTIVDISWNSVINCYTDFFSVVPQFDNKLSIWWVWLHIVEDFFDSILVLSQSSNSRKEPAITKSTLFDCSRSDSLWTPQAWRIFKLSRSIPWWFWRLGPINRFSCSWEWLIIECSTSINSDICLIILSQKSAIAFWFIDCGLSKSICISQKGKKCSLFHLKFWFYLILILNPNQWLK